MGKKSWDLFFWLGSESTQDEQGTVAYKAVELDTLLGDVPIQFREVQGVESKKFLTLFNKMTILEGGVDSGFNHVKPTEYTPRLMRVQGLNRKKIQLREVPLKMASLNNSDTFILDAGLQIYHWNGDHASHWEKRRAMEACKELEDTRNGRAKTQILDGLEDCTDFWKFFTDDGATPGKGDIDEEHPIEIIKAQEPCMVQISDAKGELEYTEVARGAGKLTKDLLDPDDVFIVDITSNLFVWVGKGATKAEKREGMVYAGKYLSAKGRNACPVMRVSDGFEPKLFWDALAGKVSKSY